MLLAACAAGLYSGMARMFNALLTADDFAALPESPRYRRELVRGQLVREPRPNAEHGQVVVNLTGALLEQQRLGHGKLVLEAGFRLAESPPTVRGPDLAFITASRVPSSVPIGFWTIPPDLAVEVVSAANSASEIQQKILDYFQARVRLVWVIDPRTRSVTVYRSLSDARVLTEADTLQGDPVLPTLAIQVQQLFIY